MRNTGLRFLLPYMRPYRGALLLGTLYAIIGAGASAFSPTLLGWAIDELNGVAAATGARVIASGGVGNISDLELLARVAAPNVEGAIVGRALYEGRFTVAEGIAALA